MFFTLRNIIFFKAAVVFKHGIAIFINIFSLLSHLLTTFSNTIASLLLFLLFFIYYCSTQLSLYHVLYVFILFRRSHWHIYFIILICFIIWIYQYRPLLIVVGSCSLNLWLVLIFNFFHFLQSLATTIRLSNSWLNLLAIHFLIILFIITIENLIVLELLHDRVLRYIFSLLLLRLPRLSSLWLWFLTTHSLLLIITLSIIFTDFHRFIIVSNANYLFRLALCNRWLRICWLFLLCERVAYVLVAFGRNSPFPLVGSRLIIFCSRLLTGHWLLWEITSTWFLRNLRLLLRCRLLLYKFLLVYSILMLNWTWMIELYMGRCRWKGSFESLRVEEFTVQIKCIITHCVEVGILELFTAIYDI